MISLHRGAVLLGAGLLAATVGCAEDPIAPTTTVAEPDLTISMFEYGFEPSTISADEGSTLVLRLRNDGTLLHDWAILSAPIKTEADLRSVDILVSSRVEPSAVATLEVDVPAPGTYQIICSIAGHFSEGMEGTLNVEP